MASLKVIAYRKLCTIINNSYECGEKKVCEWDFLLQKKEFITV